MTEKLKEKVQSIYHQALDLYNIGDFRRARGITRDILQRYGDSSVASESNDLKRRLSLDWLELALALVGLLAIAGILLR